MSVEDLSFIAYEGTTEVVRIPWRGERLLIGRRRDAELRVPEPTMSSVHAEIVGTADGTIRLRDLGSLNGTQLNGRTITDTSLTPGDLIRIGRATILVANTEHDSLHDPPTHPSLDELALDAGQTVKLRLDELATDVVNYEEDSRILLLRDLVETLKATDDRDEVLDRVRRVMRQGFTGARVFVMQPDGNGGWHDPERQDARPSLTFVTEAAHSHSAILSTSLPKDDRFSTAESVRISGIQSAVAAPTTCDGKTLAVLYIDRLGLPGFTKRDLYLLGIVANHVSAVLENASRIAALERAQNHLAKLNRELEQRVEARTVEIRRQADEIAQLAEAKDQLLGIAAHDIRGPLTVIQGTVELLQLRLHEQDQDALQQSLAVVHETTHGLARLLSELLDAKAIEAGKIQLDRIRLSVETLLNSAAPVARLAATNKQIQVGVRAPADLEVEVDPQRLGQAITNLLLNAIKFSEPGTHIALEASETANGVEIVVQDQGIGIPEEELDRLFRSFEQGEAGQQLGGSGLGLMIAKRLVELHGGALDVTSEVGVGTRFRLQLPRS